MKSEITFRSIIISIFLAVILAASNTYLALKIGILTSASIPAAILSMGILRFFRGSSILENNLIQTAASAGEAIAGGIVYTIPALIIIHYWTHFGYLHNFFVALIGGVLGVLFSVPLRKVLVTDKNLRFPEGQAIANVLMLSAKGEVRLREMLSGGLIGGLIEFAQSGLQIVSSSVQGFFTVGKTIIGFGTGFSATLIGAGYLMGFSVGLSLLIGAVCGWLIIVPVLSGIFHSVSTVSAASSDMRFIGIGSLLTAGVWTLLTLLKPIGAGILKSLQALGQKDRLPIAPHERDIPLSFVAIFIVLATIASFFLLKNILPMAFLAETTKQYSMLLFSLLFIVVVGFIFAAICGYFSGLVGVTASPGSAIVIGGLLISALVLKAFLHGHGIELSATAVKNASAVVIIIMSVVTGIACITNDNIQDLKVGHMVGSTPWKQQIMLLVGVVAASAVIPLLMQLLFSVYGLGGVFPHAGMDASKMLPAPVPAVLATITLAVFSNKLPTHMLLVGIGITVFFIIVNAVLQQFGKKISVLGVAMGLYLPLSSTGPLFIGSLFALITRKNSTQRSTLFACGLVAGAALMDVLLAVPFAISGNPDVLKILPAHLHSLAATLGVASVLFLGVCFYRLAMGSKVNE